MTKTPPHAQLQKAAALEAKGIFLGSPLYLFDSGRLSLMVLLHAGLYPNQRVLEIGCGALRSGYWLIHFLDEHCYYGIEPNATMLAAGINHLVPLGVFNETGKAPAFDNNDCFDASVFLATFDFFLACSIWSHAAKGQIGLMLDQFAACSSPGGRFLTSYIQATGINDDYHGKTWVGRSHQSDKKGSVRHSFNWIRGACELRGLTVEQMPDVYDFSNQTWLMIERESG